MTKRPLLALTAVVVPCALGLATLPAGDAPAPPDPSPTTLRRLWPEAVKMPPTLRPYKKTEFGQYLVILNGADHLNVVHKFRGNPIDGRGDNGNARFPWAVAGGTDGVPGIQSHVGIALPEGEDVRWWTRRIEAGARHPLPKVVWSFPAGTRVYDLLVYQGQPFELRMLKKDWDDQSPTGVAWKGHVLWESGDWPPGYAGVHARTAPAHLRTTGNKCLDCHSRAGGWERYGPLVRGNDFVFSWNALAEGTLTPRKDFPVKQWNE